MKKLLTSLTALALVSAMVVPVAAFADDPTYNGTGADPSSTVVLNGSAESFTVSIPATFTLSTSAASSNVTTNPITLTTANFNANYRKVVVNVKTGNNPVMSRSDVTGTSETVTYTVYAGTGDEVGDTNIAAGGHIADLDAVNETADITFGATGAVYGSYSGTITFDIALGTK